MTYEASDASPYSHETLVAPIVATIGVGLGADPEGDAFSNGVQSRLAALIMHDVILMVDNYDSFTYNVVQYLGELGADVRVFRNDKISLEQIAGLRPDGIVISPGPCDPDRAGISVDVVRSLAETVPLLGVCLGHQCIGQAFGGKIVPANRLMHGKTSEILHDGRGLFAGIEQRFVATRYHSLVVDRDSLPDVLEVSAWTDDGEIMGLRHRGLSVEGVQFHPESILTTAGKQLLANYLASAGLMVAERA